MGCRIAEECVGMVAPGLHDWGRQVGSGAVQVWFRGGRRPAGESKNEP